MLTMPANGWHGEYLLNADQLIWLFFLETVSGAIEALEPGGWYPTQHEWQIVEGDMGKEIARQRLYRESRDLLSGIRPQQALRLLGTRLGL